MFKPFFFLYKSSVLLRLNLFLTAPLPPTFFHFPYSIPILCNFHLLPLDLSFSPSFVSPHLFHSP